MSSNRWNMFSDTPRGDHWLNSPGMSSPKKRVHDPQIKTKEFKNAEDGFLYNRKDVPTEMHFENSKKYDGVNTTAHVNNERKDNKLRKVDQLPLVSTEALDISRQRALVISVFFLIQAYKIYDNMALQSGLPISGFAIGSNMFNFLFKYLIVDAAFFFTLPVLNIPKLTFPTWVVISQVLLVTSFNIALCNNKTTVLLGMLLSAWKKFNAKEFTITGNTIKNRQAPDYSSHFKGALTVKILPENTAFLNPFQSSYCFPLDGVQGVDTSMNVPIRVNSSSALELIQIEYTDLYTKERELLNFTSKSFSIMDDYHRKDSIDGTEKSSEVKYLTIPLKRIGIYQLKTVIDANNLNLKIQPSQLIVPHCPTITVVGFGDRNRCVGDSDVMKMELHGVPPLKLSYTKEVDGVQYTYFDSNLHPENFDSPLMNGQKAFFSDSHLNNPKWARSHPIVITLDNTIQKSGTYKYKINKLIDGFGNEMDYSTLTDSQLQEYDLTYDFFVHGIASAYLSEKFNPNKLMKKSIFLNIKSDRLKKTEYTADLEFINERGVSKKFTVKTSSESKEIEVSEPGLYKILKVKSEFCPGVVSGKSNVLVTKPVAPELNVVSKPILDECVGQVGLNFDLSFTGVPPFTVPVKIYRIENNNRVIHDTKYIKSESSRKHFSYGPKHEGTYEIVFESISNNIFSEAIPLQPGKDYTFQTSMRVKPGARISKNKNIELCLGHKNNVAVELRGEPPFELSYDIVETSSNKRSSYSKKDLNTNIHDIELPPFKLGGEYILSLVSVKDAKGCVVSLSEADAKINVRRDIPTVAFASTDREQNIFIKEGGTAKVPIKLGGIAPFKINYEQIDHEGNTIKTFKEMFSSNSDFALSIQEAGLYKLTGVKDKTCEGKVEDKLASVAVKYLDKPSFVVQANKRTQKMDALTFKNDDVCELEEASVDLSLIGSPPFILKYDLITPAGKKSQEEIQVATKYVSLKFPSSEAGVYTMIIKSLSDSNYDETSLQNIAHKSVTVAVRQSVNPAPMIELLDSGKIIRTCFTNLEQADLMEPFKLKINRGKAPFVVTVNVYHESTSRVDQFVINDVNGEYLSASEIYKDLKMGNHEIRIVKVVDANGCVNENMLSSVTTLQLSVVEAPKIHLLDSTSDYCVGDYVSYQLNGVPPYQIGYEFNGIQLKFTEKSSQFVRYASEPGVISIRTLQDAASKCVVDFQKPGLATEHEKLSLIIHPIPSVTVSQGKYTVADIHEGDQVEVIFSFEGTPPFSLTYIRAEDPTVNGKQQVIETHKITDIYEYEYRVVTSLQGTYEAIEVADAHCFAKNDAFFQM